MVSLLERGMLNGGRGRRGTAEAIAALCVGGMVVARAMDDRAMADRLREDCMSVALALGGWGKNGARRITKNRFLPSPRKHLLPKTANVFGAD
jgi:TetR/AcrR family transcriptional regulator, transcriptional repressor for nem operon